VFGAEFLQGHDSTDSPLEITNTIPCTSFGVDCFQQSKNNVEGSLKMI